MANRPRNPENKRWCGITVKRLICHLKRQGLTHREIESIFYDSGYCVEGDGAGTLISKYLSDAVTPTAKTLGLMIIALRDAGYLPTLSPEFNESFKDGNSDLNMRLKKFNQWVLNRAKAQGEERKKLARRISAIHRANHELIDFLESLDGTGYDGWDWEIKADLDDLNLIDQSGNPIKFQRDRVKRMLNAANDAVANISLEIDYENGGAFVPSCAGNYHPKPDQLGQPEQVDLPNSDKPHRKWPSNVEIQPPET